MILGAGETAELTAGALHSRGVQSIFVANRSYDRAAALAEKMSGKAIHFDEWQQDFHDVDILIGSTSAPHHVLTAAQLAPIMRARPDRPLYCIDLAVPRDIDPGVAKLEGVYLYAMDELQEIADHSMNTRRQEIVVCEQMIERHAASFLEWLAGGWSAAGGGYRGPVSGDAPEGAKS
jgi:glutamyl-tRNA reductase